MCSTTAGAEARASGATARVLGGAAGREGSAAGAAGSSCERVETAATEAGAATTAGSFAEGGASGTSLRDDAGGGGAISSAFAAAPRFAVPVLGRSRTDGGAGGTATSLGGAGGATAGALAGASRNVMRRALSRSARTSVCGRLRDEPTSLAAIFETSRRDATSSCRATSLLDPWACAEAAATELGRDSGTPVPAGLATARRLRTVPGPRRMLSCTTSCVFCFSRLRFRRSTASTSTDDMWFRTSVTPIDWNSPTTAFGSRFSCFATS